MPFYDFKCENCSNEFNILASVSDMSAKKVACPDCKSKNLNVVIKAGTPAIIKSENSECANAHSCGCAGTCPHAGR